VMKCPSSCTNIITLRIGRKARMNGFIASVPGS
jgi:hypothetical protein